MKVSIVLFVLLSSFNLYSSSSSSVTPLVGYIVKNRKTGEMFYLKHEDKEHLCARYPLYSSGSLVTDFDEYIGQQQGRLSSGKNKLPLEIYDEKIEQYNVNLDKTKRMTGEEWTQIKKERSYSCRIKGCKRFFGNVSARTRHEHIHGDKKFPCTKCKSKYSRKDNRDKHQVQCNKDSEIKVKSIPISSAEKLVQRNSKKALQDGSNGLLRLIQAGTYLDSNQVNLAA